MFNLLSIFIKVILLHVRISFNFVAQKYRKTMHTVNIAIFASGSGTNAQKIAEFISDKKYLQDSTIYPKEICINPKLILSNKPQAYVLERAMKLGIDSFTFTPAQLREGHQVDTILDKHDIDYIVLAGFLLKLPERIVNKYNQKIINLHPSLLPKYGGKGMYGDKVHQAVLESGETESGITIHLVDNEYDNGEHLFQAKCPVNKHDTADTLAQKIHNLEWKHYPEVVCRYICQKEN